MPYNRDDLEWGELIRAGYRVLKRRAVGGEMLTYSKFTEELAAESELPQLMLSTDRAAIGPLLAAISDLGRQEHPDLLISVLVYSKGTSSPGKGFFELAKNHRLLSAGAGEAEEWKFVKAQIAGLDDHYSKNTSSSR
ncbi:hypothetical protein [Arthrobacter sp. zg-Y1110]|uniref:hypothetical protein n=1 Tax=Arthrobacter sp. zg-Y1110 TaxID=2886932 RepID=UPI001D13DFD6|nr:hypothetical protein [Arthrobacter sp. zg-Y1110]MCC3292410.1 hypothetical protein [Arthrobacter sp. zg-Y1110]UWX87154.1 hypothetical protein N2K99_17755 [Arthrobacter sp. zg-Y1110]